MMEEKDDEKLDDLDHLVSYWASVLHPKGESCRSWVYGLQWPRCDYFISANVRPSSELIDRVTTFAHDYPNFAGSSVLGRQMSEQDCECVLSLTDNHLEHFPPVSRLNICDIGPIKLSAHALKHVSQLRTLKVCGPRAFCTNNDDEENEIQSLNLRYLPNLQRMDIGIHNTVHQESFPYLSRLRDLRVVVVKDLCLTDDVFSHLSHLTNLKLFGPNKKENGFTESAFGHLTSLRALDMDIYHPSRALSSDIFMFTTKLTKLSVVGARTLFLKPKALSPLEELRQLKLDGHIGDLELAVHHASSNLTKLTLLGQYQLSIGYLDHLKNLCSLQLFGGGGT
jgi:hypothetical protein